MTDQELIRALRTNGTKADGCHDCYLGYLAYQAADRLTSLMKDLGRVTRQWRICELRPSYQPGDTLWVRETWCDAPDDDPQYRDFLYLADYDGTPTKWRPSIHMPKEAARLFLRVTGVRVERLQESFFDQGDAPIKALQNEGIDIGDQCRQCIENYGNPCCNDLDPELEPDENGEDKNGGSECGMLDEVRSDFAKLWDNTVKPEDRATYGWEAHPWVFVIEFERISKDEALGGGRD